MSVSIKADFLNYGDTPRIKKYPFLVDGSGSDNIAAQNGSVTAVLMYVDINTLALDFRVKRIKMRLGLTSRPFMSASAFGHNAAAALTNGFYFYCLMDGTIVRLTPPATGTIATIKSNYDLADCFDCDIPGRTRGFDQAVGEELLQCTLDLGDEFGMLRHLGEDEEDKIVLKIQDNMTTFLGTGYAYIEGWEEE